MLESWRDPRDPRCCPTRLARKSYRLNAGGLKLISSTVTGTLSLATLENVEWTLEETNGKPHPTDIEPPTLRVAGGAVSGFGGCNRYQGRVQEKVPGNLAITRLASTMMACPEPRMGAEGDFLRNLGRASAYRFVEGRLALSFDDDGQAGVLLFAK